MKHTLISLISFIVVVLALCSANTLAAEVSAAGGCSSPNSHPDAWRFYDRVKSFPGWTGNFYKEDTNSKEIQYKRHDMGGQNNAWVDSSDIHYHISHGGSRWDSYWGKNLTAVLYEDGTSLVPSEARNAWGDTDLEWIAFRNCKLLNDTSRPYWATAMNRLHLLLGFKTNSSKHNNFGRIWANKMKKTTILWWSIPGQTITQAWFNATDATQPSGTTARVLAEVYDNYNDHLWGNGYTSSDPPNDNWYWWWDHVAGSPPYLPVNKLSAMYVYQVVPRTVNDQYVQEIGAAFGIEGEVGNYFRDTFVMADLNDPANPKILEISKTTGHFNFRNDGKLFVADPTMGQFDPKQAVEVAQSFLNRYKLLPADARAYSVEWDTITEGDRDKGTVRQVLSQNTNVVWARQIEGLEGTQVSVAGSGARLKVYIAEDGSIMGGLGNWRNIEPVGQISVNNMENTWAFFKDYGQKVAVEPALIQYDEAIPNFETATQLYYEYSSQISQAELIPCWCYEVDYYLGKEFVLTADTFIPAAERFLPPVVDIVKPAEFQIFNVGDTIGFYCRVETGFGTKPYRFRWESSIDGVLSTQQSFDTDLLSVNCPDASLDCSPLPHTISVTVTDAKGIQSSDAIQITIDGPCDECEDLADLNQDNIVDLEDFAHWASRYLMESGHGE